MQDYLNLNSYFDIKTYTETFTYNQLLAFFTAGTLLVTYLINLLPKNNENNENNENTEGINNDEEYNYVSDISGESDENDENDENTESDVSNVSNVIDGNNKYKNQSIIDNLLNENKKLNTKIITLIDQIATLQRHLTTANEDYKKIKKYERKNINLLNKINNRDELIKSLTNELEEQRLLNEDLKSCLSNKEFDEEDSDYDPFSKLRDAMRYMTVSQLKSRTTKYDISTISNNTEKTLTKEDYISALLETKARLAFKNDSFTDDYIKEGLIVDSQQYINDNIDEISQEWTLFLEQRRPLYG